MLHAGLRMQAAAISMRKFKQGEIVYRLWQIGQDRRQNLNKIAKVMGVAARANYPGLHMRQQKGYVLRTPLRHQVIFNS